MTESEKRSLVRFNLKIPAVIMPADPDRELGKICLLTRDLSGFGGFFSTRDTKDCFQKDAALRIRLILDFKSSCASESDRFSLIEVEGRILRTEESGIAVSFDRKFKISPIEGV